MTQWIAIVDECLLLVSHVTKNDETQYQLDLSCLLYTSDAADE